MPLEPLQRHFRGNLLDSWPFCQLSAAGTPPAALPWQFVWFLAFLTVECRWSSSKGTQPAINWHSTGNKLTLSRHTTFTQPAEGKQPQQTSCFYYQRVLSLFHAPSGMDHFFKNLKFIAISAKFQNGWATIRKVFWHQFCDACFIISKGERPITINELLNEQETLRQIRKYHIQKLFAWNNPPGILLCHKHGNWIRWQKRELKDGHPITTDLRKTETELAEKLAVNLYRIICIQTIQKQINDIEKLIRNRYSNRQSKLDDIAQEEPSQSEPEDLAKNSAGATILAEGAIRKLFLQSSELPRRTGRFLPCRFALQASHYSFSPKWICRYYWLV